MPAPANTTAGTAIIIAALPYATTQDVNDGGTTHTVWYGITPDRDGLINISALGDLSTYKPTLEVFSPDGVTSHVTAPSTNKPLQFYGEAGVPYLFKILSSTGNVSPAILTLTAERLAETFVPAGSIAVNDDTNGFPLVILSASDALPLATVYPFPAGEQGDILDDGTVAVEDISGVGSDAWKVGLFDRKLAAITTNTFASGDGWQRTYITSNRVDTFYLGYNADYDHFGGVPSFRTLSKLGVAGSFIQLEGTGLLGLAPSNDETKLYYSARITSTNKPIKVWDLINNLPLSDLVVHLANYTPQTILVLADGSLIVLYVDIALDTIVKHYSAAGATLHTHNYGSSADPRLASSIDQTTYWIWLKPTVTPGGATTGESQFKNVAADGTVISAVSASFYEKGVYGPVSTLTPTAPFGHSESCPFWITRPVLVPVIDKSNPCCESGCGCHTDDPPGTVPRGSSGAVCAKDEPVVLEAFYKRCTGGGTVPTADDVEDSEDWADEFPQKEPDSWLTIQPQSSEGEWKIGRKALSDPGRFVEARLEEISAIERRSSDKDGHYPPARLRVVAHDDDGVFRGRLADETTRQFINREARFDLLSYAGRKAGLDPIRQLQGRIVEVQPALDRKAIIEVQDIMGAQYGALDPEKTIGVPIGDEHPDLPVETRGRIYPIILGEWSDAGKVNAQGEDVSRGVLPAYDCGASFREDVADPVGPDPEGRIFGDAAPIINQAIVNILGGGDITSPIFMKAAPLSGGEIGQFSTTLVLDPNGNGAGGPSDPHAARYVFDEPAVPGTEYLVLLFQNPAFDPITNPTGDTNVRYKVVTAVPPIYPVHPEDSSPWGGSADFTSLTDGAQWGVQTTPAPSNLGYTITGTPGTTTYTYNVSAVTPFGETLPSETLVITDGPDVLSATDKIVLTWDPPAENADAVIDYRVRGRTNATPNQSLAFSAGAETYTDAGTAVPTGFNVCGEGSAVASEDVWAWLVCAIGTVDVHAIYGSDLADNDAPGRTQLSTADGYIDGPYVRTVGGIEQTGFWARGPVLNHHRRRLVTFVWNGCGYVGENDLVIDQAFLMLQTVLNEFVEKNNGEGYRAGAFGPVELFSDGTPKFWTSQFQAAQDQTAEWLGDDLGYIGAMAIIQPMALSEFLRQFFVTFGGHGTTNHWGQWYPYLINPTPVVGAGRIYRERLEIARLLDHRLAHDETENRVTYRYLYDPDGQAWRASPAPVRDTASIAARGGDKIGVAETSIKDCPFGNDAATMADRWARHLTLYANPPRYAQWVTNLKSLPDHNGAPARFSHRKEGLGVTGETATPGVIMHTSVSMHPYEVIQTAMLFASVSEDLLHLDELGVSAFGEVMVGG